MEWLNIFNGIIGLLFTVCYFYQYIYILIGLFAKPRRYPDAPKTNRFAVLISARNEKAVIGQLCDSIRAQDYPAELVDIVVIADNCTDNTAEIAREHGAAVYERNDLSRIGKGYALEFVFEQLKRDKGEDFYDGYFVIDADNLLEPNFISEMNKCFSAGNRIITSYRNSKNYGDNWISAGYSLWFIRDAKYLNNSRNLIGASGMVAGTGFLVHKDVIKETGGWKFFLLSEDVQFTVDRILAGDKVAYCHHAVFYDEQPTRFSQSWRQRKRWSKGYLQVIRHYGARMLGRLFKKGGFSCFDMLMNLSPAFLLSAATVIVNLGAAAYAAIAFPSLLPAILLGLLKTALSAYLLLLAVGLITLITEWKKIRASAPKKILTLFAFPIFIFTYLPISLSALVTRTEWKPIEHKVTVSMEELNEGKKKHGATPKASAKR